jgi:hypothetical protein
MGAREGRAMNAISANYHRTRLKPSSSARLERWALALREAQIERKDKHVLDDSNLQAHIRRRFESEWLRDGAPVDALIAIRTTLGVESVEYCLARAELRAFLTNEEARVWRDTLLSVWKEDHVSLSAAVWWIATGGEPRDCDDEELENAAKTLLRQARSKEHPISVKGRRSSASSREAVPRDDLSDAMPFFGMDERKFFSGAPCLHWNSMLEDSRLDVIEDRSGARTWCDLSIEREDMLQLWPAKQGEVIFPIECTVSVGDASMAQNDATLAANHRAPSEKGSSEPSKGRPVDAVDHTPRRRGPKPKVTPRVIQEMEAAVERGENLNDMKEEEMASAFNASRDICRAARDTVLSRNSDRN